MPLVVEIEHRTPFRSAVLGELFDVRNGRVGFLITRPFKAGVDLKIVNRLTQAASTKATVAALRVFVRALRPLLRESSHTWYWFRNPGASAPPGVEEVRSTHASGPCWSASGGFDICRLEGRGVSVRGDARSSTSFDTLEGTVEIPTESVDGRFGRELELLERWFDGLDDETPCTVWLVEGIASEEAEQGEPWHTFDHARLEHRAPSLRQAVTAVLGEQLKQRGFRKARAGGDAVSVWGRPGGGGEVVWARSMEEGVTYYLTFEPGARSASSFRLILKRHPPAPGTFVTEAVLGGDRGGLFDYCGRDEVERQLRAAWDVFEGAGVDWMADPRRVSAEDWSGRGLLSNVRKIGC